MQRMTLWGLVPLICVFLNCSETLDPAPADMTTDTQALGPCAVDLDCDIADYNSAIQACHLGTSLTCDIDLMRCVGEFDLDCMESAMTEFTEDPADCDDGVDNDLDGFIDCWDIDCAGATCDDGNQCTLAAECVYGGLEGGTCQQVTPEDDETPCSDSQYCTVGDECMTGECIPGGPRNCSAFNEECAIGACDEDDNVCFPDTAPMDDEPCDDETFCTTDEYCSDGVCDGGGLTDCSHLDETCGLGVCDLEEDTCALDNAAADGTECGDESEIACVTGALCESGECLGYAGNHTMCDDGEESTFDVCYGALAWLLGPDEFEAEYMDADGCVPCGADPRESGVDVFYCSIIVEATFEVLCDDEMDDDGDGDVDCDDSDCIGDPNCDEEPPPTPPEADCDDEIDNDGDGDTDCDDTDCVDNPVCAPVGALTVEAVGAFLIDGATGPCGADDQPIGEWLNDLTSITWDPTADPTEGARFLATNGVTWSPAVDGGGAMTEDNLIVAFGPDADVVLTNCEFDLGVWACGCGFGGI